MRRNAVFVLLLAASLAVPIHAQLSWPDVMYYKFNEGQTITNAKAVVNFAPGNTFAPFAMPSFETTTGGIGWGTGATAQTGGAWDNGTPGVTAGLNRLLTATPSAIDQSFTIECWIKTHYTVPTGCGPSGCALGRLWGDYSTGLLRCYVGWYNEGANFLGGGFATSSMTNTYPLNAAGIPVADATWHHIAWVYDATTMEMWSYVDGQLDQYCDQIFGSAPGTQFQLGGVILTGSPFGGVIDEFRWWGEARSQTVIQAYMNSEVGPPPNTVIPRFLASTVSGTAPLLVQFHDFTVADPNYPNLAWDWDVDGDSITDYTVQNPTHVYAAPNSAYNVTLTVTASDNSTPPNTISQSFTIPSYINTGNLDFTLATTGQGDVYLAAPPPPMGWADGYTLLSFDTSAPLGYGWFFGLQPDLATIEGLLAPPFGGSPLHFINVANPNLYPEAAIVLPPGSATPLVGSTLDAVVIYRDAAGNLLSFTGVARAAF